MVAMLLLVVVVVAAGCGGGHSDKKANEAYANGVCTAIESWATEVKTIATVPTGGVTKASLDASLAQFDTATTKLVSQVKAVPPPNTSEGQAAKKQVDKLASQVEATSAAVKSAASKLPANATVAQMVSALSNLVPQFQTLRSTAQSTVKSLQSAGGSLASAFKNTKACTQLG